MAEKVKLHLRDWQFNMGLLGLYNVLSFHKEKVEYKQDYMEFEVEALEAFEEKYFSYLIEKYGGLTHWQTLEDMKKKLDASEEENYTRFEEEEYRKKEIEYINQVIKALKDYLTRGNYQKVYPCFPGGKELLSLERDLSAIKASSKTTSQELILQIKDRHRLINRIHAIVFSKEGKRLLFAKTLIYGIIQNSWDGISFLNRQTKETDPYLDFKKEFTDKAICYLKEDKSKYKLSCFVTGMPVKNEEASYSLSFLKDTGFDLSRKPSNIWEYSNDIFICDIARLVYICMPCGLMYSNFYEAVFVNANRGMRSLIETNRNLSNQIKENASGEHKGRFAAYRALLTAIRSTEHSTLARFELSDVQVIRMNRGAGDKMRYRFTILSKEAIRAFNYVHPYLLSIISAGYTDGGKTVYLYPLVVERILDHVNLFNLIHSLLVRALDKSLAREDYFTDYHIYQIALINEEFMKGAKGYEMAYRMGVKTARQKGEELAREYCAKGAENKLSTIAYRLLNALKTRNSELFVHNLLNCYMYVGKEIPSGIEEVLIDEDTLGEVGYAFVTGLATNLKNQEQDQ